MNTAKTFKELIIKYIDEDNNIEKWDNKLHEQYTIEALDTVTHHAFLNNGFYREKMAAAGYDEKSRITSITDLEKLPFTLKDELRGDPWKLLSVDKSKLAQIHISTGTTKGIPLLMLYSYDDLYHFDLVPKYYNLLPVSSDDIVINALPYEMSSAGLAFHRVFQNGERAAVVPVGKGGHYSLPEMALTMMKWIQPEVMITSPSYAVLLAEISEQTDVNLGADTNLRIMWLTGEGCSDNFRQRVEKLYDCPAYFFYGSLECGPLGIECKEKNGYHIPTAHIYLEIVDPDSEESKDPGEIGEIVVTTLLREAAPIIRYRTGDLGYIEDIPCECGVKLPRLFLRGRVGDQIQLRESEDGFSPIYLENFLMEIEEVGNWFLFIVENQQLSLEIEKNKAASIDDENLKEKIQSKFEFGVGISLKEINIVDEIPKTGGKNVRVIHK